MTGWLRAAAVAIAMAGAIDPAVIIRRPAPIEIDVHADPSAAASDVRARLLRELGAAVRTPAGEQPRAAVLIGDRIAADLVPDDLPVSTVVGESRPNLRIVAAEDPPPLLPGQTAILAADVEASGLTGTTSVFVLEQQGLELGRTQHVWRSDGVARILVPFVPPGPGVHAVRLAARPARGEIVEEDNAADVAVRVHATPLRVAVYEPRPSWAAGFVRAALEADAAFEVGSVVRPSRGVEARAGAPPRALRASQLSVFDAVLVGAPEELSAAEVEALGSFADQRGGAVVLIPDRRPSGPYLSLLPTRSFDEVLLERPAVLETGSGVRVRGSEFALPAAAMPGATAIAGLSRNTGPRPAIVSWVHGDGVIVYSGALDAWRYRGDSGDTFATFWRGLVAAAALAAPPPVEVALVPRIASPGASVRVRARLRRTEYEIARETWTFPEVRADWNGRGGAGSAIRMWPSAERGVFEGEFDAPSEGSHQVRVGTGTGAATAATLIVKAGAARPQPAADRDLLSSIAPVTGGVRAAAEDLSPVIAHVQALAAAGEPVPVHPMRSAWWVVPFAGALCLAWLIEFRRDRVR